MGTYYRIQQPGRSVETILDPECQISVSYSTDTARQGVSACGSIEELAAYFAQSGCPLEADCLLVTFDGSLADEDDEDAALGAVLTIPVAIISTERAEDRFMDLVGDAYDRIYA